MTKLQLPKFYLPFLYALLCVAGIANCVWLFVKFHGALNFFTAFLVVINVFLLCVVVAYGFIVKKRPTVAPIFSACLFSLIEYSILSTIILFGLELFFRIGIFQICMLVLSFTIFFWSKPKFAFGITLKQYTIWVCVLLPVFIMVLSTGHFFMQGASKEKIPVLVVGSCKTLPTVPTGDIQVTENFSFSPSRDTVLVNRDNNSVKLLNNEDSTNFVIGDQRRPNALLKFYVACGFSRAEFYDYIFNRNIISLMSFLQKKACCPSGIIQSFDFSGYWQYFVSKNNKRYVSVYLHDDQDAVLVVYPLNSQMMVDNSFISDLVCRIKRKQ